MDVRRFVVDGLRQIVRQVLRWLGGVLSTIPAGWLVVMGILALPIAILSVAVAVVFFVLVALLALLALLFYAMVWRAVFRRTRQPEKVIEAEYSVKSNDDQ